VRPAAALLLLVAASAAATIHARQTPPAPDLRPTVILVAFDGWRWDFHTLAPAPHVRSVIARGVRAEGLIPPFPSKTFPSFYSMATGLYPGHHGIVANNIRDPATGRLFGLGRREEVTDPMWWGGDPIWNVAQRAGRIAATMFWPGSEAPIGGMSPRYWKPYDESMRGEARVDQVLEWLDLPVAERPTLVTLYFEDVDSAAHDHPPDSSQVRDAITRADGYLGRLLRGLEARALIDTVNLVLVSDHGMAEVTPDRVVVLDEYLSLDDVDVVDINPTLGLWPKPGREEAVYRALDKAHPRLRVYRRRETPAHWHYRDHPRIPPIVGVVDEGWQLLRRQTVLNILAGTILGDGGAHGYDAARAPSMRGLFVAAGPVFRRGASVRAFDNVNVYQVLAAVLGLPPGRVDADTRVARSLLATAPSRGR
jgi:predicted AlkP superfamily pyrophosphatase or phosphodiesterase